MANEEYLKLLKREAFKRDAVYLLIGIVLWLGFAFIALEGFIQIILNGELT